MKLSFRLALVLFLAVSVTAGVPEVKFPGPPAHPVKKPYCSVEQAIEWIDEVVLLLNKNFKDPPHFPPQCSIPNPPPPISSPVVSARASKLTNQVSACLRVSGYWEDIHLDVWKSLDLASAIRVATYNVLTNLFKLVATHLGIASALVKFGPPPEDKHAAYDPEQTRGFLQFMQSDLPVYSSEFNQSFQDAAAKRSGVIVRVRKAATALDQTEHKPDKKTVAFALDLTGRELQWIAYLFGTLSDLEGLAIAERSLLVTVTSLQKTLKDLPARPREYGGWPTWGRLFPETLFCRGWRHTHGPSELWLEFGPDGYTLSNKTRGNSHNKDLISVHTQVLKGTISVTEHTALLSASPLEKQLLVSLQPELGRHVPFQLQLSTPPDPAAELKLKQLDVDRVWTSGPISE
eukprot:g18873.t1